MGVREGVVQRKPELRLQGHLRGHKGEEWGTGEGPAVPVELGGLRKWKEAGEQGGWRCPEKSEMVGTGFREQMSSYLAIVGVRLL